jgi:two-component system NtrC family sensor kinase
MKSNMIALKKWFRVLVLDKYISIRDKFLVSVLLIIIFLGGISTYISYRYALFNARQDMERKGKFMCGILEDELIGPILNRDVAAINGFINSLKKHEPDILYVVILDPSRHVLGHTFSGNRIPLFIIDHAPSSSPAFFRDRSRGLSIQQYTEEIQSGGVGTVLLGLDNSIFIRKANRLSTMLWMVSIAFLFLTAVTIIFISGIITRPIRDLILGFRQFVPGGSLPNLSRTANDEMRLLADAFIDMAERLNAMDSATKDSLLKIIETEKLAGIGVLASGVAHEINNPIAGIEACAYRLQKIDGISAKQREYIDLILASARHIQAVTRDLLQYARHPDQKEEDVDLRHVASFAMKLLHYRIEKNKLTVIADFPDFPCLVSGIRAGLVQVVINGMLNAIDASPVGNSIEIRIVDRESYYLLEISDHGKGVDPAVLGKVFDPFYTTKGRQGTGLGLYVSYSIIRSHGGKIELTSAHERGATLAVELPKLPAETILTALPVSWGEGI